MDCYYMRMIVALITSRSRFRGVAGPALLATLFAIVVIGYWADRARLQWWQAQ